MEASRRLTVCLCFDFDAVSLWTTTLHSRSPSEISRGEFGPRTAVPRILDLLAEHGIPATFFVPAVTARQFGGVVADVVAAGHEVAAHGDLHERLTVLDRHAEEAVLRRSIETLGELTGSAPRGFRAPGWELSVHTIGLLEDLGFGYDSSQFATDFVPYRARRDDQISDGGWIPGPESEIWEIPVAWELDDFPAFFLRPPHFNLGRNTADVYRGWVEEFDYALEHVPGGTFSLTMHPQLIGRGPRLAILARFIDHVRSTAAAFARMGDVAAVLDRRHLTNTQEDF